MPRGLGAGASSSGPGSEAPPAPPDIVLTVSFATGSGSASSGSSATGSGSALGSAFLMPKVGFALAAGFGFSVSASAFGSSAGSLRSSGVEVMAAGLDAGVALVAVCVTGFGSGAVDRLRPAGTMSRVAEKPLSPRPALRSMTMSWSHRNGLGNARRVEGGLCHSRGFGGF